MRHRPPAGCFQDSIHRGREMHSSSSASQIRSPSSRPLTLPPSGVGPIVRSSFLIRERLHTPRVLPCGLRFRIELLMQKHTRLFLSYTHPGPQCSLPPLTVPHSSWVHLGAAEPRVRKHLQLLKRNDILDLTISGTDCHPVMGQMLC